MTLSLIEYINLLLILYQSLHTETTGKYHAKKLPVSKEEIVGKDFCKRSQSYDLLYLSVFPLVAQVTGMFCD